MNKIKVSHEVPLCLLNSSHAFNDYDYCLPHLLDEEPIYLKYFREAKENGRYIIMDNSLHELGEAYDPSRLIHWVNELKPNEFIVPDVWEDMPESILNAEDWSKVKLPDGVTKVAVVQATTLHEAAFCYESYKRLGYEKIAFSYGASYYNDVVPHPNKDLGKALGRMVMIASLYETKIIKDTDRVHLLGCAVPQEFGWYNGYKFIESIDTSNPVMASIEGLKYTEVGLMRKPIANMNKFNDISPLEIDFSLLSHNLDMFKKINNL